MYHLEFFLLLQSSVTLKGTTMNKIKTYRLNILLNCVLISISANSFAAEITVARTSMAVSLTADAAIFGEGPAVALHEDFDSAEANRPIEGWLLSSSHNTPPIYSNFTSITGGLSGMSRFEGSNYNSSAEYKNLPDLDSAYVSYYFRIQKLSGEKSRNIKLLRLSGGYKSSYTQSIGLTQFHNNSNGIFLQASIDNAESKVPTVWMGDYSDDKWHRAEYFTKLSTPAGASNGITLLRIDGKILANKVNIINEETGMRYKWVTLPFYADHSPGGDYRVYYDNVIISAKRARVELCESESYTLCKAPILAKIDEWTANQIKLSKVNLTSAKPFMFIFDNNDVLLNSKGLRHCSECPKPPTPL